MSVQPIAASDAGPAWQGKCEAGDDLCPICRESHRPDLDARPLRVLVVEDEPSVANLIAYNLEQDGYSISLAADGVAALQALRDDPPDLLVLDLLLPLQSGWQVLREIRSRPDPRLATLPVLVVSALACDRLDRQLRASGAQRVLGKPFSVQELREVVRSLLGIHASATTDSPSRKRHGALTRP